MREDVILVTDSVTHETRYKRTQRRAYPITASRAGVDCTMCRRYPCFKGMDVISSNLAITCRDFDEARKPFNPRRI